MKHLKSYESIEDNKIKIGQYVIISLESNINDNNTLQKVHSFLKKNIGQIVDHSHTGGYIVKYDELPNYMKFLNDVIDDKYGENTIPIGYIHTPNIIHSSSKEELLPFINANKFNL